MKNCVICKTSIPDNSAFGPYGVCNECKERLDAASLLGPLPEGGIRHDGTKPDWSLIPLHLLEGTVRVLEFGAKKYSPHNWRKGLAYSRVTNSLQRHLNAFNSGEELDPETGLPHVDHIMCNALFLVGITKELPTTFDDRFKPQP